MTVLIQCDSCGVATDVDQLNWGRDGGATCPQCVEIAPKIHTPPKPFVNRYPLYMLYSGPRLLHITQNLSTADQWKVFQKENWWFFSVDSILVKFFESGTQAAFVETRLTHDLAPRYGRQPNPEGDLEGETHDVYHVDVNTEKRNLEKTLNLRISLDVWLALQEAASRDAVKRTDWARSALYEALRRSGGN